MFGGNGGGVPHVPISNTTVKPSSADGTWTAGSWESRTSPSNGRSTADLCISGAFLFLLSDVCIASNTFLRTRDPLFAVLMRNRQANGHRRRYSVEMPLKAMG